MIRENKQTILFFGTQFAPGHQDVVWSYYELLKENFNIVFCLCDSFYSFDPSFYNDKKTIKTSSFSSFLNDYNSSNLLVFIITPSKANYKTACKCKRKKINSIYIFHEPYSSFGQYYKKWGSSIKNVLKAVGLSFYNGKPLISKISGLILPSENALAIYRSNYKNKKYLNKKMLCVPLMFDKRETSFEKRKYISFIGNVDVIKNFSLFVDYISHSSLNISFLIATNRPIGKETLEKIENSGKHVVVISGNKLSKKEIELFYQQSYAVWLFYKDSTQSGVLPMCYKNGTPVLSSDIPGLSQNIINKKTGFIFKEYNTTVFDDCFFSIVNSFDTFQKNVFNYYDETFVYLNYKEDVNNYFMSFFRVQ